jgi:hypothetical protein
MRIDLHLHTTASDGLYAPSELVQLALTHQMDVIAVTDHDTLDGVAAAQNVAAQAERGPGRSPLRVLAGVELSAQTHEERHMLGYLVDTAHAPLLNQLALLKNSRVGRMEQMVAKLEGLGLPLPFERVLQVAGEGTVGRPHLARVMVERGYVSSIQEAFDRYLGDDGPAYVPYHRLLPEDAIRTIHEAGGVAVLAHPGHLGHYREVIEALVPHGLDGIEVYYYDHSPSLTDELARLARQFGLVMTVGSDFHRREADGSARIGSVRCPDAARLLDALYERAARYQRA